MNAKILCLRALALLIVLCISCQPATAIPSPSATASPSPTPPYTTTNCPPGDHTETLTSGGQVRRYRLHVPLTYQPEKPVALVLGFHGAGSNSEQFETYSQFSNVADQEGFLVAYPQALGQHPYWNTARGSSNPDLQFVRDLIDDLESRCNIDPNQVYASGHSNGGGMANRLACDLADRIAAIGTVSGAYQGSEDCSPSRPVAVFAMHDTDDPVVPYNGFQNTGQPPAAYFLIGIPIPQWASAWATRNDCNANPSEVVHTVLISEKRWSDCRAGADVILYSIQGGGHGWPSDLIDVPQLFWDFFVDHPLGNSPLSSSQTRPLYTRSDCLLPMNT